VAKNKITGVSYHQQVNIYNLVTTPIGFSSSFLLYLLCLSLSVRSSLSLDYSKMCYDRSQRVHCSSKLPRGVKEKAIFLANFWNTAQLV